jgi:hypothetical protein
MGMERLTDIERKILGILRNYSTTKSRMPTMYLLKAKTGRNDEGVEKVLDELTKKGYIDRVEGAPISDIVIIQRFEPDWRNWWSIFK